MNAVDAFELQMEKLEALRDSNTADPEFIRWRMTTTEVFRHFLPGSTSYGTFQGIAFEPGLTELYADETDGLDAFSRGWNEAKACIKAAIEHIQMFGPDERVKERVLPTDSTASQPSEDVTHSVLVLISHSSRDKELAETLIDLLRSGLGLPASQIRCTSVDGYRLPAGVDTNERLRTEIKTAKSLIGLLTPNSLTSTYVLFELGARWGAGLSMIPLVAGIAPEEMRGPHSVLNALSCETEGQLIQLVEDIGKELDIRPESAAAYLPKVRAVMALAGSVAAVAGPRGVPQRQRPTVSASGSEISVDGGERPRLSLIHKSDASEQSFVRMLGAASPNTVFGTATLIISNNGPKPNAIVHWGVSVKDRDGKDHPVDMCQDELTSLDGTNASDFAPHNVTPIALPAFSATEAHLLFLVDVQTLPNPVVFDVNATDITGEVYRISISIPNVVRNTMS